MDNFKIPQKPEDVVRDAAKELQQLRGNPVFILGSDITHRTCFDLHAELVDALSGAESVDVIVHSLGGDPHAAFLLTRQVCRHVDEVSVFVPFLAKSAATLVCLGASELVIGEWGELGPLDTQAAEAREGEVVSHRSALERFKALESIRLYTLESADLAGKLLGYKFGDKEQVEIGLEFARIVSEPLFSRIDPLRIGQSHRALQIAEEYAQRILRRYRGLSHQDARSVVDHLVRNYPAHEFVIDREEAADLALPVRPPSDEEEELLWRLAQGFIGMKDRPLCDMLPVGASATQEVGDEAVASTDGAAVEGGPSSTGENDEGQLDVAGEAGKDDAEQLTAPGH